MTGRRLIGVAIRVAWLGAAAFVLQWAGRGVLATPALTEPDRWAYWLHAREPIVAAFSLLRLAALRSGSVAPDAAAAGAGQGGGDDNDVEN